MECTSVRLSPTRGEFAFNIIVTDVAPATIWKMIRVANEQSGCSGVEVCMPINTWLSPEYFTREEAESALLVMVKTFGITVVP